MKKCIFNLGFWIQRVKEFLNKSVVLSLIIQFILVLYFSKENINNHAKI
jgi:hypothetical protein